MNSLWKAFLAMMREAGSPELTLEDLHKAIAEQFVDGSGTLSSPTEDIESAPGVSQEHEIENVIRTNQFAIFNGKFSLQGASAVITDSTSGTLTLSALLEFENISVASQLDVNLEIDTYLVGASIRFCFYFYFLCKINFLSSIFL